MIQSPEEFYRLRVSDNPEDYRRAAHDSASEAVWRNVIRQYPVTIARAKRFGAM